MAPGLGGLGVGLSLFIFAEIAPVADCCLQFLPLHWVHSVPLQVQCVQLAPGEEVHDSQHSAAELTPGGARNTTVVKAFR